MQYEVSMNVYIWAGCLYEGRIANKSAVCSMQQTTKQSTDSSFETSRYSNRNSNSKIG